jgi:hypothetical protein
LSISPACAVQFRPSGALTLSPAKKVNMGDLTDAHVCVGGDGIINPDSVSVAAYYKAYTEYNWYPGALAPLYTAL